MGVKGVIGALVLAGATAAGGYYVGKNYNPMAEYKIENKEGANFLYSKALDSSMPITVLANRMILGNSADNLTGYDLLKTKEITEVVMKQVAQARQPTNSIDAVVAAPVK
jgi:hypothetical protein